MSISHVICNLINYLLLYIEAHFFTKMGHFLVSEGIMAIGTVKWFNNTKGFGFLRSEEVNADVFAHFSEVQIEGYKTLPKGAVVQFDLEVGPKGMLAKNIRIQEVMASLKNIEEVALAHRDDLGTRQ